MDSQERFENMVGLVEAHQYEWAIWQAARRGEPDGQPVVDAMQAYLRQCRSGGMPKEVSDQIERAVKQASHLGYFAAPTPERAQESAGGPSDELIEQLAVQYIAPHAGKIGMQVPYQQTEQFKRVKAYTLAILAANKETQP